MKKILTIALALMVQVGAMAQVSALKEATALAGKDADKAAEMIKAAINGADVTAKDQAAACNALALGYLAIYDKESAAQLESQTLKQMGKEGKAFDEKKGNEALAKAFEYAIECDKYDAMPDAKGKVKPKFRKTNCETFFMKRPNLLNAGLYFYNENDKELAKKIWVTYLECMNSDLFATKKSVKDDYASQCAYFISLAAYNTEDAETLNKYVELAKTDSVQGSAARQLEVAMIDRQYKASQDKSLLDVMYAKSQDAFEATHEDMYFNQMMYALQQKNDEALMMKTLDEFIAKNPESTLPYIHKGDMAMNAGKIAEAITNYEKVAAKETKNAALFYNIAVCYRNLASELAEKASNSNLVGKDKENFNKYLTKAAENFEKVRALDPNQETVKYSYLLYSIYSGLGNTEKAAEIKAAYNIQD